jgi:hypothetical protein
VVVVLGELQMEHARKVGIWWWCWASSARNDRIAVPMNEGLLRVQRLCAGMRTMRTSEFPEPRCPAAGAEMPRDNLPGSSGRGEGRGETDPVWREAAPRVVLAARARVPERLR